MTDFDDMAATPIEIVIDGKTYKARKLSLDDVWGAMGAAIKSEHIKDGHTMASALEGPDKVQFLAAIHSTIPTGSELQARITDSMGSIAGIKQILIHALRKDQPDMTEDEIGALCTLDNLDELASLVEVLTGTDGIELPDTKKKKGTRATNRSTKKRVSKKKSK